MHRDYCLIDAHCHFNQQSIINQTELQTFWQESDYRVFFSSIIQRSDLDIVLPNGRLYFQAGLHPYLYFEHTHDYMLNDLADFCSQKKISAIGECGLDYRYGNHEEQMKLLLPQLELAEAFNLPVIFHCVKAYYDLANIVKKNFPKIRGILHGFNANCEITDLFKGTDLFYAISSRLFLPHIQADLLKYLIHTGRYVFETDVELNLFRTAQEVIEKYKYTHIMFDWICTHNDQVSYEDIKAVSYENIDYLYKIQV